MEPGVPTQGGEGGTHTQPGITQTGLTKAQGHPDCVTTQPLPLPNGTLPNPTEETRTTDRAEDGDSDDSLTDNLSTNDVSRLLPKHKPTNAHKKQREDPPSEDSSSSTETLPPGALTSGALPPVCAAPSVPAPPRRHQGHGAAGNKGRGCPGDKKRPPSTAKSQQSFRADSAHIQQVAGDDCCVHCVLACLFCEVLSVCSALCGCLACQPGCEALCCCCGGEGGGAACCCDEDACSALWECGVMEDCCESTDCLEICLECCSICFPV